MNENRNYDLDKWDWDNFMFIGGKIEAGIFNIPDDDMKWFIGMRDQLIKDHRFRIEYDKPYKMRPVYETLETKLSKITDVIKEHNGSDSHAKDIFYKIDEIVNPDDYKNKEE